MKCQPALPTPASPLQGLRVAQQVSEWRIGFAGGGAEGLRGFKQHQRSEVTPSSSQTALEQRRSPNTRLTQVGVGFRERPCLGASAAPHNQRHHHFAAQALQGRPRAAAAGGEGQLIRVVWAAAG